MKLTAKINSLIRVSLLTSPVIGLLISFQPFKHIAFTIPAYLISVFVGISFSLIIWFINIYLVYLNDSDDKLRFNNKLRFIVSYFINVSIITSLLMLIKWYIFHTHSVELTLILQEKNGVYIVSIR